MTEGCQTATRLTTTSKTKTKRSSSISSRSLKFVAQTQIVRSHLALLCCSLLMILYNSCPTLVLANDSGSPPFDMSALASIASDLGSNPQIMSMVSNLFSGQDGSSKSLLASGGSSSSGSSVAGQADQFDSPDQESISTVQGASTPAAIASGSAIGPESSSAAATHQQWGSGSAAGEPLRRSSLRQPLQSPPTQSQQLPHTTSSLSAPSEPPNRKQEPAAPASSGPLSGLMSLLPSFMPNLNLGSLLGQGKTSGANATSTASTSSGPKPSPSEQTTQANAQTTSNSYSMQPASPIGGGAMMAPMPAPGANAAQSVINQVLTAYASGQIPNELIQFGLSGRVPPQIIELALSGQVPPQIIQMIITGQVPMTTINAFLASTQLGGGGGQSRPVTTATAAAVAPNSPAPSGGSTLTSTTRSIFEAIFNKPSSAAGTKKEGGSMSIAVPTLLGPIPIQIPSFPNVRRIGQIVGGTITNVASMIPF